MKKQKKEKAKSESTDFVDSFPEFSDFELPTRLWTLYSLRKCMTENMWHFSEDCRFWPTQNFLCLNEQAIFELKLGPYEEICPIYAMFYARAINAKRHEEKQG
jgi:hypothetical protein